MPDVSMEATLPTSLNQKDSGRLIRTMSPREIAIAS